MTTSEHEPLTKNKSNIYYSNRNMNYGRDGEGQTTSLCRRIYPMGFFTELRQLLKMSAPLIAQQLTMYMLGPIALIFCGHLGKLELDAVALACSMLNVFGISIGVGLSSACDTLFSQVYGSESKHRLGIVLQRSLLFIGLAALPCIAIHINTEAICLLLGQDAQVARMAGEYMLVLLPGVVSFFFYISLLKYIQNQNIIIPTLIIGGIVNVMNALLHYLLLYVANYGVLGSAISQSICYFTFLLLTIVYILWSGIYKETWHGWDVECLQNWGQFLHLAVFGLFMVCIEWWAFEAGIFLAGLLGTAELGAQSLVLQIEIVLYMFPLGNGIAAAIRVGQFLGSGDAKSACTSARVAITFICMTGIVVGILLVILRNYLPLIFSNEPDVIAVAAEIFPVMGVYMLFDSVAGTCSGILRGCGRQRMGAGIVFCGYFIALTIGIPLMFLTPLGIPGFWIGLCVALCLDAAIFFTYIMKINWEKQAVEAYERVTASHEKTRTAAFEDSERRALLSSSNIHSHTSLDLSSKLQELPAKPLPFSTVLCRRMVGAALMVGILLLGIVLRVWVIEIDDPYTEVSTPTAVNATTTTDLTTLLYSTMTTIVETNRTL